MSSFSRTSCVFAFNQQVFEEQEESNEKSTSPDSMVPNMKSIDMILDFIYHARYKWDRPGFFSGKFKDRETAPKTRSYVEF